MTMVPPSIEAGFTSSFLESLHQSQALLTSWINSKKEIVDDHVASGQQSVQEHQHRIDRLRRELASLQRQRGTDNLEHSSIASIADEGLIQQRTNLERKQSELQRQLDHWKDKKRVEASRLEEVLKEEANYRQKAQLVADKKKQIKELKSTTMEDLTRGLLNYGYIGLTFEKIQREDLRGVAGDGYGLLFKFTKLDPNNVKRSFSFVLHMNHDRNDYYEVSKCDPPLDTNELSAVLEVLNSESKNKWNSFIVGMRKLFKKTLT